MELYDWMLALHVISAFGLAAGVVMEWVPVLATRSQGLGPEEAGRFGAIAGPLTGAFATLTLIFGIVLVIDVDAYEILDFWIVAAIVLWAVAMAFGPMAGKALAEGPSGRQKGITLLAINTVILTTILILMIWKPGA